MTEILTAEDYRDLDNADEYVADLRQRFEISAEDEARLKRAYIDSLSGDELAKEALMEIIAEIKKEAENNR